MKNILSLTLVGFLIGCSTVQPRVRTHDPIMRVAIDPESISRGSYTRLLMALVQSGRFIVIDRSVGFQAVDREQRRLHRSKRFGGSEKYAEWGSLYGVGGIIVGIEQCQTKVDLSSTQYNVCLESLSILNATTGEIMAVGEKTEETESIYIAPNWNRAVDELIDNYPKNFVNPHNVHETVEYAGPLKEYRQKIQQASEVEDRSPASDNNDEETEL